MSGRYQKGSVLIYVLWILVLITGLAYQLGSASRVDTLSNGALSQQMKVRLQLESAIEYAYFQILAERWNGRDYQLRLNHQDIGIKIFNETGFVSVYRGDSDELNEVFHQLKLDGGLLEDLKRRVSSEDHSLQLNSFDELLQLYPEREAEIDLLASMVSIYHQQEVNPLNSPPEMLLLLDGVDKFRVERMLETEDPDARAQLRDEIIGQLLRQTRHNADVEVPYYRVLITLDGVPYRAILRTQVFPGSYRILEIRRIADPAPPATDSI